MDFERSRPLLPRPLRQLTDTTTRRDNHLDHRRHNSRPILYNKPNNERQLVFHLRRSELAGWRTRSLFPSRNITTTPPPTDALRSFLPVLKLRGLPYFCTKRHVLTWFDDLAIHIVNFFFVAEIEPLNSGFALVTFDSPQSALAAWWRLHKKPIIGKRFVEVFGLFPPHCPLTRRELVASSKSVTMGARSISPHRHVSDVASKVTCPFCGLNYSLHSDSGIASMATSRMRQCVDMGVLGSWPCQALMHTAFLSVPALLYQDAGAVSRVEVESFDPEGRQGTRSKSLGSLDEFEMEKVVALSELEEAAGLPQLCIGGSRALFFDLNCIDGYDMKPLLCEIVRILLHKGGASVAEIGNELSTRARAYLFLSELKLRNVLESFPDVFRIFKPNPYLTVTLTPAVRAQGESAIMRLEPFQLTKRRRNNRKERVLPPLALDRHRTLQHEYMIDHSSSAMPEAVRPLLAMSSSGSTRTPTRASSFACANELANDHRRNRYTEDEGLSSPTIENLGFISPPSHPLLPLQRAITDKRNHQEVTGAISHLFRSFKSPLEPSTWELPPLNRSDRSVSFPQRLLRTTSPEESPSCRGGDTAAVDSSRVALSRASEECAEKHFLLETLKEKQNEIKNLREALAAQQQQLNICRGLSPQQQQFLYSCSPTTATEDYDEAPLGNFAKEGALADGETDVGGPSPCAFDLDCLITATQQQDPTPMGSSRQSFEAVTTAAFNGPSTAKSERDLLLVNLTELLKELSSGDIS